MSRLRATRKLIIAAESAKFGRLQIKLGVMPGVGGSQRLTRVVGKAKAVHMYLMKRIMDAVEAERFGLISRIIQTTTLLQEASRDTETVVSMFLPVAMMRRGR